MAWRWRRNISPTAPTIPLFPRPCLHPAKPSAPPPCFAFPTPDCSLPRGTDNATVLQKDRSGMLRIFALVIAAAHLALPAQAQERWVGSWATSQQVPEERNALGAHDLDDAT